MHVNVAPQCRMCTRVMVHKLHFGNEREICMRVGVAEKVLWMVGSAALIYSAAYIACGSFYQRLGEEEFALATTVPAIHARHLTKGAVVGRVRVPRLQISAMIFEGTDESELMRGVGHWQGSPIEGNGNVVLAAHRDTFFKGLKGVREGDEVFIDTPAGTSSYRVSGPA